MIIFKEDWLKYPTAIADTETTNTSFLVLAETYRRMGIDNYLFPLALLQPCLQGVDPHSPDLTIEQKKLIMDELQWNPWYYLREFCKIPQQGVDFPSMYLANRSNIAMMWCFLNHFDFANILVRQGGKSVGGDCLNDWIIHLAGFNTVIQLYTHNRQLRSQNIARLKGIRDTHPPYANFYQERIDADNTEMLTCKALKNQYLTVVSQSNPVAAHKLGRGITSPIVQSDEGPFCENIHITFPVMMGSTSKARDLAEENGTFYGNLMTTTAGSRLTKEGEYVYKLVHDGMSWNERIFDCRDLPEAREMVRVNSKNKDVLMINGTFSAMQIGKSKEWLRGKIAQARGSRDDARRDYLNEWTSGSGESPLSPGVLESLRVNVIEPVYTQSSKDMFLMRWFIPESSIQGTLDDGFFSLGLDTANMAGNDANAWVLKDLATMEVIAVSEINTGSLFRYGLYLADLLAAFPNVTLVIEHKSSATGILDACFAKLLTMGINPFKRIYNRIFNERAKYGELAAFVLVDSNVTEAVCSAHKAMFGFNTTGASRKVLYGQVLQEALHASAHLVKDKVLSEQMSGLIYKNDRVDHPSDSHDDLVIGYLLGQWFSIYARHTDCYGIPSGYIRSKISANGATMTKKEVADRGLKEKIVSSVKALKAMIDETPCGFLKSSMELQLTRMAKRLSETDRFTLMEDLLTAANEKSKTDTSLSEAVKRHTGKGKSTWY